MCVHSCARVCAECAHVLQRCAHVCADVYAWVCVQRCMCAGLYVCVQVCACVCGDVRVCVQSVCVGVHVCAYTEVCTCVYVSMSVHSDLRQLKQRSTLAASGWSPGLARGQHEQCGACHLEVGRRVRGQFPENAQVSKGTSDHPDPTRHLTTMARPLGRHALHAAALRSVGSRRCTSTRTLTSLPALTGHDFHGTNTLGNRRFGGCTFRNTATPPLASCAPLGEVNAARDRDTTQGSDHLLGLSPRRGISDKTHRRAQGHDTLRIGQQGSGPTWLGVGCHCCFKAQLRWNAWALCAPGWGANSPLQPPP